MAARRQGNAAAPGGALDDVDDIDYIDDPSPKVARGTLGLSCEAGRL